MASRPRVPLADYPARRIALIKPSALGDVIQCLPVLTALRRRYPDAHITWVVNRGYESLLAGHPDLDATLPVDRGGKKSGLLTTRAGYRRLFRRLRDGAFDLVIDLQGLLRSGLMTRATRAARRVGLSTAREGATWFYTDVVPVGDFNAIHAVDRYWLVAGALGLGDRPKEFRFPPFAAEHAWAADLLAPHPRPWLFFGVGSRWETKCWPAEHFAELGRRAQAWLGGTIFFVGAKDEAERSDRTAARLRGPSRNLAGRTTLPQLAALLGRADVMVANDTGPLHLAAALGRPVVAPYTCTKVRLNGPFGQEAGTVESRVWCQGSYRTRCGRLECMAELTPDRLWPVLEGTLRRWHTSSRSA